MSSANPLSWKKKEIKENYCFGEVMYLYVITTMTTHASEIKMKKDITKNKVNTRTQKK